MQQLLHRRENEDPLVSAPARLPQGRARFDLVTSDAPASPRGVRPFGLRFAKGATSSAPALPSWRYDPISQIAVGTDGTPWYRGIVDMTMKTTGPSPDGGGSTGGEEWGPDYLADEPAI